MRTTSLGMKMTMGEPMDPKLENSMAVDTSEITIPMSLNDFARRERFKVGFGLIVDTVTLLKSTVNSVSDWSDMSTDDSRAVEGGLQACISTFESVLKRIQEGENDE